MYVGVCVSVMISLFFVCVCSACFDVGLVVIVVPLVI